MLKKIKKIIIIFLLVILLSPLMFMLYVDYLYDIVQGNVPELKLDLAEYNVEKSGDKLICKDSYLRKNSAGLWELYIVGSSQEKGVKQGALTKDLMNYQEDVFVDGIHKFVPSKYYLKFLKYLTLIFNRNLDKYIDLEYKDEIFGMTRFCSDKHNDIASPYIRQLNYHAAHDIGHAMQQYMLIACTSFGVWSNKVDSMLVGRVFDFYINDDFAKNKLITFAIPDEGYKYVSISWAGMIGVLSGMNEAGLTVSINAGSGAMAKSAKTPISILIRKILQYSSTIEEAYALAKESEVFVSDSILISSAKDKSVAIIEKTPDETALFKSDKKQIISTNHFQSDKLKNTSYNLESIKNSDSLERYNRTSELLANYEKITPEDVVDILRQRHATSDEDIGLGNNISINQSIAHHSVIFEPQNLKMWVSTSMWQSGKFIAYDLSDFFNSKAHPKQDPNLAISEDSNFVNLDYPKLMDYRNALKLIENAMSNSETLSEEFIDKFLTLNPKNYNTYKKIGDYYFESSDEENALKMYKKALKCKLYKSKYDEIENMIRKIQR